MKFMSWKISRKVSSKPIKRLTNIVVKKRVEPTKAVLLRTERIQIPSNLLFYWLFKSLQISE